MDFFRHVFFGLKNRERLLVSLLIAALVLLWMVIVVRNLRENAGAFVTSRQQLNVQSDILELAPEVQTQVREALSGLDSSRTYSPSQLVGRLDSLARSMNLRVDLSAPRTEEGDLYAAHLVRLRIDNGDLTDLSGFNDALQAESPYIVITQFQFSADRRDPRQIDATFDIASFELKEELAQ